MLGNNIRRAKPREEVQHARREAPVDTGKRIRHVAVPETSVPGTIEAVLVRLVLSGYT